MKLQYCSDLHTEHMSPSQVRKLADDLCSAVPDAAILILAGDIGTTSNDNLCLFLDSIEKRYETILYVLGNHEYYSSFNYYGTNGNEKKSDLFSLLSTYPNIKLLDNDVVEIEDITIAGTTLWFDVFHPLAVSTPSWLNDFRYIPGGWSFLREQQLEAELFMRNLLVRNTSVDVLVTHHGVTPRVHPKWKDNPTNIFFYSDITEFIKYMNIRYVIHGHQHDNHSYSITTNNGLEAIVSTNSKGYPNERHSNGFVVDKYLDLV